jgi:hypothetical protein
MPSRIKAGRPLEAARLFIGFNFNASGPWCAMHNFFGGVSD